MLVFDCIHISATTNLHGSVSGTFQVPFEHRLSRAVGVREVRMNHSGQPDVDRKYPAGQEIGARLQDYQLRVELRADSAKEEEELPHLGPRLANNLTGRAFESFGNINRAKLRKSEGWSYLLEHLELTRGKTKVDFLGDAFTEFFLKKEAYRKDGEEINDYETWFRVLVRKIEKALTAVGSQGKVPSEVYGWFLLNIFMKLEASDTANARGQASVTS